MAKVPHIPQGYHTITPYLLVRGAAQAVEYYKNVFGATEIMRMPAPGGKIGHAELKIGDSHLMLADEVPEMGYVGPQTIGGAGSIILLYVEDVDRTFSRALTSGGKVVKELKNQFYGDRSGTFTDPFGYQWTVATHVEDVSEDEMRRRMAKMAA